MTGAVTSHAHQMITRVLDVCVMDVVRYMHATSFREKMPIDIRSTRAITARATHGCNGLGHTVAKKREQECKNHQVRRLARCWKRRTSAVGEIHQGGWVSAALACNLPARMHRYRQSQGAAQRGRCCGAVGVMQRGKRALIWMRGALRRGEVELERRVAA